MQFPASSSSLKARALRLLAQREHSRHELQGKLARHVQQGDDLPALLDALGAKDFINPERVAESVVHRRAPQRGTQSVVHELRQKGLDEDVVRAATATLADTEQERALAVWRKRFGHVQLPTTWQERRKEQARQVRFLAARGFAPDVVHRVVQTAGAGDGEDEGKDEDSA